MDLLIRNGRIIDPAQGIDHVADLLVSDGKIAKIGERMRAPGTRKSSIDATGMIVCPGFIDLHCHLREPGFEDKETIATGTLAAARGGFTTVCCMPNTSPPIATPDAVNQLQQIASANGIVHVLPIAAVTEGRSGKKLADMAALALAGAIAFSDDGSPVWDTEVMRQALTQSRSVGLPVIDHCEDLPLSVGGSMNEGAISAKLRLKGIPYAAEDRMTARDIRLAQETAGRLHLAHVSTAGSVELIRQAKAQGVRLTAEAAPHHLTLTEEAILTHGTAAKVNPPLRTQKDADALVSALRDGIIDAIATDHAPHTREEKARNFDQAPFGISGFETALGSLMTLVHRQKIELATLIAKLTAQPARIIGKSHVMGNLKPGSPADITIFDPDREWIVNPEEFASKGKNTPLAGTLLKGRVMATIVSGRVVHRASR